jgi:acyl-CoA synthetase
LAHRHPDIAKAAAFSIADERLGERVCLGVISRSTARLDALEVLTHLHTMGLSKYDMPEYFIQLDAFPLTASGKILKRELKTMAQTGQITPSSIRWKAPQNKETQS